MIDAPELAKYTKAGRTAPGKRYYHPSGSIKFEVLPTDEIIRHAVQGGTQTIQAGAGDLIHLRCRYDPHMEIKLFSNLHLYWYGILGRIQKTRAIRLTVWNQLFLG
jgi:hypothetical protein